MAWTVRSLTVGAGRHYEIIGTINDDHLAVADTIGARIGDSIQDPITQPVGGMRDENGDLWIACDNSPMRRMTDGLEIEFTPAITVENAQNGDGIDDLIDMSMATDGSGWLLPCSWTDDVCRVYDRDTGQLISTIGVPGAAGNIEDGRLTNPHSALRLSNGNILVSSFNGEGNPAASANGSITEWDVSTETATLVAVRLLASGNQISAVGLNVIQSPAKMIFDNDDPNSIWVSEYDRGRVTKIDTTNWLVSDIIEAPSGVPEMRRSYGLCQMQDGTIVVSPSLGRRVYGINPITKALVFEITPELYGSQSNNFRGLFEIEPGVIAWTDWSSQHIYSAPISDIQVEYEEPPVPTAWEIIEERLPQGFDLTTRTLTIPPYDVGRIPDEIVVLLRRLT